MKPQKLTRREQLLLCIGLLLTTMPMLFKPYITMPDFARGFLQGVGMAMEISAIVLIRKRKNASCRTQQAD
jgi:hypothetical protein